MAVVIAAVGVAALVLATDRLLASSLPAGEAAYYADHQLGLRLYVSGLMALRDEIAWRLVLMTAIVALGRLALRGHTPVWLFVVAIVVAQAASVAFGVPLASSLGEAFADTLRYFVPGLVWGWLYWRHGWLAAAALATSART